MPIQIKSMYQEIATTKPRSQSSPFSVDVRKIPKHGRTRCKIGGKDEDRVLSLGDIRKIYHGIMVQSFIQVTDVVHALEASSSSHASTMTASDLGVRQDILQ